MKIQLTDVCTGESVELTAELTTEHSASSYGQPVMWIEEWGGLMSALSWILGRGRVLEITPDEQALFDQWQDNASFPLGE